MQTCSMAPKEGNSIVKHGVLDERLNVHGVQGLKVADLSICPDNVGCNTYVSSPDRFALLARKKAPCADHQYLQVLDRPAHRRKGGRSRWRGFGLLRRRFGDEGSDVRGSQRIRPHCSPLMTCVVASLSFSVRAERASLLVTVLTFPGSGICVMILRAAQIAKQWTASALVSFRDLGTDSNAQN